MFRHCEKRRPAKWVFAKPSLDVLESRLVPSSLPRPSHVVVVIEENKDFSEIIGSPNAPYINSLASQGALMTNSFAITHPSQPNYLDLFSGSDQGVTSDTVPPPIVAKNLASELIDAGLTFGSYSESMPSVGFTGTSFDSLYFRCVNPWADFSNVPASDRMPFAGYFPSDYAQLPTLSFVIPNLADNMHDGTIQQGDTWLHNNLDAYVHWAQAHNSLLVVTWDEGHYSTGNQVPTLFIGPMVKPGTYGEIFDHFNVLRTLEDMYDLAHAGASAGAAPLTDIWQGGDDKFIQALYSDYLGRAAGSAERAAWVTALPQLGRQTVANAIARSPEALTRLVDSLYLRFLDRPPDAVGASTWLSALEGGATEETVISGLLGSVEFARDANATIGSSDSGQNFTEELYAVLLNRTADAADVSNWSNALPALGARGVAEAILNSAEYRSDALRSFYGASSVGVSPTEPFFQDLLHRTQPPGTQEVSAWVASPLDTLSMAIAIAGSEEYYAEAQKR